MLSLAFYSSILDGKMMTSLLEVKGRSSGNQRIEAWWSKLREGGGGWWINLFKDLCDSGNFRETRLHKECLKFCFLPLLRHELYLHRTKHQESAGGNIAESCKNVVETQRLLRDSGNGYKTFTYDSVAAVTAEPDHFLAISVTFPMKETNVFATRKCDEN